MIVDPGINIDPGYIPYDRGLQQDIYLKVHTIIVFGFSQAHLLLFLAV